MRGRNILAGAGMALLLTVWSPTLSSAITLSAPAALQDAGNALDLAQPVHYRRHHRHYAPRFGYGAFSRGYYRPRAYRPSYPAYYRPYYPAYYLPPRPYYYAPYAPYWNYGYGFGWGSGVGILRIGAGIW